MDADQVDKALAVAQELKELPTRLGWKVTGVVYGHGKVIVYAVSPRGRSKQYTRRIDDNHRRQTSPKISKIRPLAYLRRHRNKTKTSDSK